MNDDYDISAAFSAIEDELIASMIRNMRRHKVEEIKEDKQWSMWQTEQLKSLEKYRVKNQKRFGNDFAAINKKIGGLIRIAGQEGGMSQEKEILQAIRKGFKAAGRNSSGRNGATAEFFRQNDQKLEALIQATTHDMEKAEVAVLRRANDQYRKVIYNAQVYANTGAGTYEKAVDMATKDFLSRGIDCIEYANGSRHTISDYADMAIKTASKRAYLQAEGEKRKEWGISTVIMNKRGNPCPKCLPFCGKVLIDDVWSGGPKSGISPVTGLKYPLLSKAIAKGLYHPRCKDVHSTYFEGVSSPPTGSRYTKDELDEIANTYSREQKQRYAQRQAEKFERLEKYSLDEENQKEYARKAEQWKDTVDYMSNSFRPKYADHDDLIVGQNTIAVKKVLNSLFDMVTDTENSKRNKAVRLAEKNFRKIQDSLPDGFEMPTIAVVDFEKHGLNVNAIGGYHNGSGVLYINSKYDTPKKILDFVNKIQGQFANTTEYAPYLHELGHKYYEDCIKSLAKSRNVSYNKAKDIIDSQIYDYIHQIISEGGSLKKTLSKYAADGYSTHSYTEIIAESFSVGESNSIAKDLLKLLGGITHDATFDR